MSTTLVHQGSLKLRASCDACASSKVKCDKERPSCRRCVTAGTSCIYGISRKHGKQIHRRRIAAEANAEQHMASTGPEPFDQNSGMSFEDLMQDMGLMGSVPPNTNDEAGFFNFFPPRTPEEWSSWMETNHTSYFNPSKQRPSLQRSNMPYEDAMTNSPESAFSYMNSSSVSSDVPSSMATPECFSPLGFGQPSPDLQSLGIDPNNHHCYNLASEALKSLNLEERFGSVTRFSPGGSDVSAPQLNIAHILEANKMALCTLQRVLECPCSGFNAPLAFLNASIVSKVNYWYRRGSKIIRSAAGQPPSLNRSASVPCPVADNFLPARPQQGRAFSVNSLDPLPISVGAFDIDAEDRAALSRQLLLSELRKTAKLVERLQQKAAGLPNEMMPGYNTMNPTGSVSALYGMLASWLQDEVARTTNEVKRAGGDNLCAGFGQVQPTQYRFA